MIHEIFASLAQLVRSLCPVKIFRKVGKKLLSHFRCAIFACHPLKESLCTKNSSIIGKKYLSISDLSSKKKWKWKTQYKYN